MLCLFSFSITTRIQCAKWCQEGKIENDFAMHVISYNHKQNDTCCHFQNVYCEKMQRRCVNMRLKVFSIVKPILCPRCHKPYKVNIFKRCVHCGAYLGGIKW